MAEQQDVARAKVKLANVTEELLGETKTNNTVTTLHNKLTIWLTLAIVVLAICTLISNYNSPGRYAITTADSYSVYVLDTKTNQLWWRSLKGGTINLGTNEKPTDILIPIDIHNAKQINEQYEEYKRLKKHEQGSKENE